MIKAVNEILDLILKSYGHGIIDNFARALLNNQGTEIVYSIHFKWIDRA